MKLINIYLTEVGKNLPKKEKDEILLELESSILDEFENTNQTEKDMENILLNMGSPSEVASRFHNKPLLSKEMEKLYFLIIKIATGAVSLGMIVATLSGLVFSDVEFSIGSIIKELVFMLPSLFTALISVVGMITIAAFIIDKKVTLNSKEFSISDLPKAPKKIYPSSRFTESVKITANILFMIFINTYKFDFQINGVLMFNDLSSVVLIATILLLIDTVLSTINLVNGSRGKKTTYVTVAKEILNAIFLWYLATINIFNPDQSMVPTFSIYLVRLAFLILAIITIVNVRKLKEI